MRTHFSCASGGGGGGTQSFWVVSKWELEVLKGQGGGGVQEVSTRWGGGGYAKSCTLS